MKRDREGLEEYEGRLPSGEEHCRWMGQHGQGPCGRNMLGVVRPRKEAGVCEAE